MDSCQFPSGIFPDVTPHSIAEFCLRHPIGFPLVLFILGIPFSIYASEIKAFLKVPPQRIGVWLLKARLSSSESKLRQLVRMRDNIRFALARMWGSCIFLGSVILSVGFACFMRLYRPPTLPGVFERVGFVSILAFIVYYTLYRMLADIRLVASSLKEGQKELESHIENLKKRLQPYL
jgi:hypothetical protein